MNRQKRAKPNETESDSLPSERRRALEALLSAPTIGQAAKLAGVSRITLWRYQQEPVFSAELRAARDAAFAEGLSRLKGAVDDAVGKLRGLLDSDDEGVQLSASKAVLDYAVKAFSVLETDERLRRIEEQLANVGRTNGNGGGN